MQKGHDKHSLKAVCHALTRRSSFSPLMAVDAGSFPACFTGLSQRVRRLNYVRNITFIHLGSPEGTSDRISDISGLSDVRYFWGCRHGLLLPLLSLRQACHITCHAYKLNISHNHWQHRLVHRFARSIAFQSLPCRGVVLGRTGCCRRDFVCANMSCVEYIPPAPANTEVPGIIIDGTNCGCCCFLSCVTTKFSIQAVI